MLISSLLLSSSLLTSSPAVPATPAMSKDPPVRVWFNQDGDYAYGDRAKVYAKSAQDGYLVVLQADGNGRVRVLFPLNPGDDQHVSAGKKYELKGRGGREAFVADNTREHGTVLAAVSKTPFEFTGFTRNGRWDFATLASKEVRDDPEAGLLDLVQRMTPPRGHFEYDLGTYVVSNDYVRGGYGYPYPYAWGDDPWWGRFGYGPRFGFGLGYRPFIFGRGFRRF